MINHLYWCMVSTPCGNGNVMKAKWLSLDNHLHDVHSGHSEHFPECSHGTLTENDRRKKWFRRRKYLMYHIFFMHSLCLRCLLFCYSANIIVLTWWNFIFYQ